MVLRGRPVLLLGALVAAAVVFAAGASSAAPDTIQVAAGGFPPGPRSADGTHATETAVALPRSVMPLAGGGFVWAEPPTSNVRAAGPDGIVRTVAGIGRRGFAGDGGPATQARLNSPNTAAPTAEGGLLIADTSNHRIRLVDRGGTIKTVAGAGRSGFAGDGGPAAAALLNRPRGVAALPGGAFLIADTGSRRVRRVAADGTISTVAGSGRTSPFGEGGPALAAGLRMPVAVAATADGGFLVVDAGTHTVRQVRPDGTIVTVSGTGVRGFSGDGGPAGKAQLADPYDVAFLPGGSLAIADAGNNRVRLVAADGTISTFAGTGAAGTDGVGGPAAGAQLSSPKGVAAAEGGVLIADEQTGRILFVGATARPRSASAPKIEGSGAVGQNVIANPGGWRGLAPKFTYAWQRCEGRSCAPIAGATNRTYRVRRTDFGSTLRVRVTATNTGGSANALSTAATVGTLVEKTFVLRHRQDDGDLRRVHGPGAAVSKLVVHGGARSVTVLRRRLTPQTWEGSVGILRFDTASLPDGVQLESVALGLLVRTASSDDRLRLVVDSCPGAWPPVEADYRLTAPAAADRRMPLAQLKPGITKITLPASAVTTTAAGTRICFHLSGRVPRGQNVFAFASADAGAGVAPRLVVTFRAPTKS